MKIIVNKPIDTSINDEFETSAFSLHILTVTNTVKWFVIGTDKRFSDLLRRNKQLECLKCYSCEWKSIVRDCLLDDKDI